MIKKLYSILFTLSLMAALPALGMETETYPCDLCKKETSSLAYLSVHNIGVKCTHIFCKECMIVQEHCNHKIWWQCNACSYFLNKKMKQCWEITNITSGWGRINSSFSPEQANEKRPSRELLDITNATIFPQDPNSCNSKFRWLYGTAAAIAFYGLYTLIQ